MDELKYKIAQQLDNIPENEQILILKEMEGYIRGRKDADSRDESSHTN